MQAAFWRSIPVHTQHAGLTPALGAWVRDSRWSPDGLQMVVVIHSAMLKKHAEQSFQGNAIAAPTTKC